MDGEIDQTFYDPFGRDYVLDGIYVSGKWPMYCEYRNSSYQIESIDIKTRLEGETYSMHYFYDQELFVKHYYYKEYLISGLDFLAGNRLECRHRITYVR